MNKVLCFVSAAALLGCASAHALPPINGGDTTPFGKSSAPAAPAAPAEPVKNPYVFDDWTIGLNGKIAKPTSCVAFSDAKSRGSAGAKRKEARVMITRTPGGAEEFTILMGYAQPAGAAGTIEIGGKSFKLLADADALWSEKPEHDKDIIAALKSGGGTAKVSAAGVTDTYSLTGFSGAYGAIGDKCK